MTIFQRSFLLHIGDRVPTQEKGGEQTLATVHEVIFSAFGVETNNIVVLKRHVCFLSRRRLYLIVEIPKPQTSYRTCFNSESLETMDRSNILYEEVHALPRGSEDSITRSVASAAGKSRPLQEYVYKITLWTSTCWILGAFLIYLSVLTKTQRQLHSLPRDQLSYCKCHSWITA